MIVIQGVQSQILMLFELAELEKYDRPSSWNNRVTGCFDLHSLGMGGDAYEKSL